VREEITDTDQLNCFHS